MSRTADVKLPRGFKLLSLAPALNCRLREILDRLDRDGKLVARKGREAEALAELNDWLALMRVRTRRPASRSDARRG